MRVAFVVSGLLTGGAEMMLYKLLKAVPRDRVEPLVICLGDRGRPADLIEGVGVRIVGLGLNDRKHLSLVRPVLRARRELRAFRPALVCGWMPHGNVAAWLLSKYLGVPLVWSVRQTLNLEQERPLTRIIIRAAARLSRTPKRIIYVSGVAREQHRAIGYHDENGQVLPNGFELDEFRRDEVQRARMRAELGVTDATCVIGHLARYHPQKDQLGLIAAARRVVAEEPNVLFVLAGMALNDRNVALANAVRESRLERHIRLMGETTCPETLLSAFDLFCLPSAWGEGFPNAVGEAMACELPCVVTRVGESPDLVDDTGLVVDPGDREALARAVLQLVRIGRIGRARLGVSARERIAERFSLPEVAGRYVELFEDALRAS
jgi:glycosyltransferase involved in cell wall biosynthesis